MAFSAKDRDTLILIMEKNTTKIIEQLYCFFLVFFKFVVENKAFSKYLFFQNLLV